jgi:ubiquinol-cytochrome c reductase cytochrome c1 subunit
MSRLLLGLMLTVMFTVMPSISYADVNVSYDSHGKLVSDTAPIDINDKDSIKRGAKNFANYCLSCHSAFFMRYNRIARDTGMTEEEVRELMIFTRDKKGKPSKFGDLMKVSMTEDYAKNAFGGAAVPDLSLTARARGADWLYTYLRTFYIDTYRPMGVNNLAFSDVSMPHVLWELQGQQKAVYKTVQRETEDGEMHDVEVLDHLKLVSEGKMSVEKYDAFVADLVNFMVYIAEPVQVERRSMGWKVLVFLFVFFIFAYLLKKEYWKDVH